MALHKANGFTWNLYPNDSITKHLLGGRLWEPHLLAFFRMFIKPTDTCFDCGSCFGWHTLEMARCADRGSVFAFEPYDIAFKLLQANVRDNGMSNIISVQHALSNRIYTTHLCNAYDDSINIGDSFIIDGWNPNATVGRIGSNKRLPVNGVEIACTTLDAFTTANNTGVDLIKIDVQGCELFLLQGARELISLCKPCIAIEIEESCLLMNNYSTKELVDYIRGMNYEIFYLESDYPCDHICVHLDKLSEFMEIFGPYIRAHEVNNDISNNFACGIVKKISIPH